MQLRKSLKIKEIFLDIFKEIYSWKVFLEMNQFSCIIDDFSKKES